MIGVALAHLLPATALWLLGRACGLHRAIASRSVRVALSVCGGIGVSAVTTFCFILLGLHPGLPFVVIDAVLWMAIGGLSWWSTSDERPSGSQPVQIARPMQLGALSLTDGIVRGLFGVVVAVAVVTVVRGYLALPHGDWDAWAIWNQKARFLFRGGSHWTAAFAIDWSHPGHPLLLPLSVARAWSYAGSELTIVPALVGIVFGCGIVAIVMGALDTGRRGAWIAGIVMLTPATFVREWTAQQADIPFAFFMVAGLVSLGLARAASRAGSADVTKLLFVAGALGSLAAWTKNEGTLLLFVMAVVVAVVAGRKARFRRCAWWVAGAAPAALAVAWFKIALTPVAPYYLPDGPLLTTLAERLSSPEHLAVVNAAVWQQWSTWGGPTATGAMAFVSLAAVLVALTRTGGSARTVVVVPMAMLAGTYTVYLLTSLDVRWLVATTFSRILAQIWPSLVLVAFLSRELAWNRESENLGVGGGVARVP